MQIETRAVQRFGRALTNFDQRLPKLQSDQARETLKDPYRFDFLGLTAEAEERQIESARVAHIKSSCCNSARASRSLAGRSTSRSGARTPTTATA
jgi:predicted nuclease of restriction endonuclease-like (RecB) superfamily